MSIPPHILPAFKEHLKKHTGVERDALLFWGRDSGEQLAPSTLLRWCCSARELRGVASHLMHRHGRSTAAASLRYQHYVLTRDQELAARLSAMAIAGA